MFLLEKHFFIFVLLSGICGLYNKLKIRVKLDQIDPQTSASFTMKSNQNCIKTGGQTSSPKSI